VHKAQGSEWDKVFCIFHHTHATMLQREILYTAITRPRKYLRVYYSGQEPGKSSASVFQRGVINQRIPGNTLKEKVDSFKKKSLDVLREIGMKTGRKMPTSLEGMGKAELNEILDTVIQYKASGGSLT
jgi:superfamily I DNA and RNA helicase